MEDSRMKILMTTDTLGGVWTYTMELCRVLFDYGVEVHLASLGALPSESQEKEVSRLENVSLYRSDFKLEWMLDCAEDLIEMRKWIYSLYGEIQPDLVHLNNFVPLNFNDMPVITVFHSCVQTWWESVKSKSAPAEWENYKRHVKNSLNGSNLVISPSYALLRQAMEIYKFSSRSMVIHNGRELKFSEEKNKEKIIFAMGRIWDEAKNLEILSEVAKNLVWPVYIAGDNKDPRTRKELQIKNVHFLGQLSSSEVKKYLQRASIFVSPAKYEPFGLSILEAAKAECALAISNIDTLQELWCGAATFFDPRNMDEIQNELLQLIEDENKREELAAKAKKRAASYNLNKMGERYMEVYRELIQQYPPISKSSYA